MQIGKVVWSTDYRASRAAASRQGKPMVLVFGASWCEACHTLRKSFENEAVQKALSNYVCIWLDTDKEGRIADRHNVQGLPHVEVFSAQGRVAKKMVGHQTPETLAQVLAYGAQGARGGANERRGQRRPRNQRDQRQPRRMNQQQMQRELQRLRNQVRDLQKKQAEQAKILQEILRRLRDR